LNKLRIVSKHTYGEATAYEEECEIEIGEGRPSEEELNGIVYELELEDNLAEKALARCPDPEHVDGGVEGSEERAVEPSASLRDEFSNGRGHICGGLGRFDVFKAGMME
jgi:hypothetical protein